MNWVVSYVYVTGPIKRRHSWEACSLWRTNELIQRQCGSGRKNMLGTRTSCLKACEEQEECPFYHSTDGLWPEWRVYRWARLSPSAIIGSSQHRGAFPWEALSTLSLVWPSFFLPRLSNSFESHWWILDRRLNCFVWGQWTEGNEWPDLSGERSGDEGVGRPEGNLCYSGWEIEHSFA